MKLAQGFVEIETSVSADESLCVLTMAFLSAVEEFLCFCVLRMPLLLLEQLAELVVGLLELSCLEETRPKIEPSLV